MEIDKNTTNAYDYYEKYNKQYYIYNARTTYLFINIQWSYI